jgi:hypothetical protein
VYRDNSFRLIEFWTTLLIKEKEKLWPAQHSIFSFQYEGQLFMEQIIRVESIQNKILIIRGQKVLLDKDLADLYGVPTKQLNQSVKRNQQRFPQDFMFQLTSAEFGLLRSQVVTSKVRGGLRTLPYVFTEQGVAMLSSVLHSRRAIIVNIAIMRAFVQLREFLSTHKDLAKKFQELERKYESHDMKIKAVFDAIRQLMSPPKKKKYKVGF